LDLGLDPWKDLKLLWTTPPVALATLRIESSEYPSVRFRDNLLKNLKLF
jgi:hypothetical protein